MHPGTEDRGSEVPWTTHSHCGAELPSEPAGAGAASGAKSALVSGRCRELIRPSNASGLRQRRQGKEDVGAVHGRGVRPHCAGAAQAQGRSRGI